jgi:hypothetical protein
MILPLTPKTSAVVPAKRAASINPMEAFAGGIKGTKETERENRRKT